ncbi:MAG: NAD(P)-dependent oxidoreductase [Eisenbergiella massiliensis]
MRWQRKKLEGKVEIVYYDTRVTDTETLIERAKDADILAFSNLPFKKEVLEHCDNLKMISVAFTGVDHVAMDYCRERGILVSNCAGYSNTAVPELVFGMVLNLYRYIIECNQAVREGKDKTGLVGQELEGKKFGIIGMGAIGTRTAQLARAFGCEVYGYNRSPRETEGVTMTDMDTLFAGMRYCIAPCTADRTDKGADRGGAASSDEAQCDSCQYGKRAGGGQPGAGGSPGRGKDCRSGSGCI